jgi:hypothetical protein
MMTNITICVAAEANEILREFLPQRPVPFTRQLARLGAFLCRLPLRSLVRVYQVRAISFPFAWKGKMISLKHSHAIIIAIIGVSMLAILVALAESKDNALKAQLQAKNEQITELQAQLSQTQRVSVEQNNTAQLAQDDENAKEAIAGIYEFDPGEGRLPEEMDLRSDGSGIAWELYNYTQKLNQRPIAWALSQDNSTVWIGRSPFRPEGDDLIDAKGNRWEREH